MRNKSKESGEKYGRKAIAAINTSLNIGKNKVCVPNWSTTNRKEGESTCCNNHSMKTTEHKVEGENK